MKIAIAVENGMVSQHFGRTPQFLFVDIENNKVVSKELKNNPAYPNHRPGEVPQFVSKNGANWIIAGGMGPMAVNLFKQNGIEVVLGISGTVEEVIQKILNGTLEGGESLCQHAHISAEEHEAHHHHVHGD
ncbi:MAG: NifB/NifX family molybdenum-iron cluster-binding protein [Promethearchaeota archaeon]